MVSRFLVALTSVVCALGFVASLLVGSVVAQDVVIHEVLAINDEGLADEDGDRSDWFELRNVSGVTLDLDGWFASDDSLDLTKWRFPARTLVPGELLLVFASGKSRAPVIGDLHTSFRLDGGGETLLLVLPDGVTVEHRLELPRQRADISYGLAQGARHSWVSRGSTARFLVPRDDALGASWTTNDFEDAAWSSGANGLGYDRGNVEVPDGAVNIAPEGVATQSSTWGNNSFPAPLANDGNLGNFTATATADHDAWWELEFDEVPSIGRVVLHNRDNCCPWRLRDIHVSIRDDGGEEVWESPLLNPENTLGNPAEIVVDLVADLGASVSGRFVRVRRIADPDHSGGGDGGQPDDVGILSLGEVEVFEGVGGVAPSVETDLEDEMADRSASLYARFAFDVEDPDAISSLSASIAHDDGFVAYLDGTEVARVRAPGAPGESPAFDASATGAQPNSMGPSVTEIPLDGFLDRLAPGRNVLAIHALNVDDSDDDFLIAVELVARSDGGSALRYFERPTPGAPNDESSFVDFVGDTTFSVDRGVYVEPFDLEITSSTPGATIRYTTNGAPPSENSGEVYDGPIRISGTTVIRAIASKPGYRSTNVDSQTYIYPDDVVRQSVMSRDITQHATYGPEALAALSRIPSVSLTSAHRSISSTSETLASVELIFPDGRRGFQVDAGVKRVGGHSLGAYPKNNMRIYFRREYGAAKLRYPVFEDTPYGEGAIEEFDRLNLRGGSHDSVFYLGAGAQPPSNAQYIRNRFMNDVELEMGNHSIRGRFVHVYINGTYWGHYQLMESNSAAHAAAYLGGEKEDFEAVRRGSPIGRSAPAWQRIGQIRGNWPEVQRWVDIPNFVDYMLLSFWAGNAWDWREAQNWSAEGPSNPDRGGYKFTSWDSDIVLRNTNDSNLDKGGPGYLFRDLLQHEEFRLALADGIERHLRHDGVLTPIRIAKIYGRRANEIRPTLIAEAARWRWQGRVWLPDRQWQDEWDRLQRSFFPARTDIVLGQFRSRRWILPVEAPVFRIGGRAQHGGWVERGAVLTITGDSDEVFEDRLVVDDETPVSAWVPTSDALGSEWRELDYVEGANGEAWMEGVGGVGFDTGTGYDEVIGIDLEAEMRGDDGNASVYVRVPFRIESRVEIESFAQLRLDVLFDDGFVAFLNGREIASRNAPENPVWNSTATRGTEARIGRPTSIDVSDALDDLRVGDNLLAIHAFNSTVNSADMLILASLRGREIVDAGPGAGVDYTIDGSEPLTDAGIDYEGPIVLERSTLVRARVESEGEWSAMSEAGFAVDTGLRITEIQYHPAAPEDDASPWEDEHFEFLELQNVHDEPLELAGYSIGGAIRFDFSDGAVPELASGEVVVIVGDLEAFASRYDVARILIAGEYDGRLANTGEQLILRGPVSEHVLDFSYDDAWHPGTDGPGASLVIVDGGAERDSWASPASWRPSDWPLGSPGIDESAVSLDRILPGDTNGDASVDISDAIAFLRFLFVGKGVALPCGDGTLDSEGNVSLHDTNGDGNTDLSDPIALLNYLFGGGAQPALGTDCVSLPECPDACED